MNLNELIEDNKDLLRVLIQSQDQKKMREYLKNIFRGFASSNPSGLIYLKEYNDNEEYQLLQRLVNQGILHKEDKISIKGGEYSLFTITKEGQRYLPK